MSFWRAAFWISLMAFASGAVGAVLGAEIAKALL